MAEEPGAGGALVDVCAGAKVVAEAGLLDGKRATTHWYYLKELLAKHPAVRYAADRRIVVDGGVATLVADAWSRTYRSRAVTFASNIAMCESRNGVQIVPYQVRSSWPAMTRLPAIDQPPAKALDEALQAIGGRYGVPTTDFVAMQIEYPTKSRRAVHERANAFGQTAMPRSLR